MQPVRSYLFVCLLITAWSMQIQSQVESRNRIGDSIIEPGKGFSTDTQQLSAANCYNMQISKKSNTESIIKLNEGSTYDSIVNKFGVDVTAKMSFAMFSAGASYSYLRSIQNTASSFSISYYHSIERDVALNFNSSGVLNQIGKMVYQDGQNEEFRIACGDQIISSYKQRALLFFTFNLHFNNKIDKEIIQSKLGGSIGGIASISGSIQKIATQNKITGQINLQVYQVGGDPKKIGQIISSKDPNGVYYIVKCSLTDLNACNKTVSDLISYSSTNFPTQINFQTEEGLSSFGTNSIKYIPALYFGVKMAPSFVTQQVSDARLTLSTLMQKNQYYWQNLNSIVNSYPVIWNTGSQIYNFFSNQYNIAQVNIKTLLNVNNPEQGSLGCYSSPQRCLEIFSKTKSLIKDLNETQISAYLSGQMKYGYWVVQNLFRAYTCGDSAYCFVPNPPYNPRNLNMRVDNVSFNATYDSHDPTAMECSNIISNLKFNASINTYQGSRQVYCQKGGGTFPAAVLRYTNEYYFTPYQLSSQNLNEKQRNQEENLS